MSEVFFLVITMYFGSVSAGAQVIDVYDEHESCDVIGRALVDYHEESSVRFPGMTFSVQCNQELVNGA